MYLLLKLEISIYLILYFAFMRIFKLLVTASFSFAIVIGIFLFQEVSSKEDLSLDWITSQAPSARVATFNGKSITVSKGGRTHTCSAITFTEAPTPRGTYCIRRQGEAQRGSRVWKWINGKDDWYLLEPQFETKRFRMHLHPGSRSEGCITVTNDDCFDELAEILNSPGTVKGFGYDGYPPGNKFNVDNPKKEVDCVGILTVDQE
ncbi:MAG: DUF2778 domain-containing protein, partial [Moorea sp. SIO2I5]|nr:DUF2778 domain-containing protein [Moorena sp. SIO2I5]